MDRDPPPVSPPTRRAADRLADFLVPIRSGLEPSDEPTGLSPDRAAELDRQLRELDRARAQAWVSSRNYILRGAETEPWA